MRWRNRKTPYVALQPYFTIRKRAYAKFSDSLYRYERSQSTHVTNTFLYLIPATLCDISTLNEIHTVHSNKGSKLCGQISTFGLISFWIEENVHQCSSNSMFSRHYFTRKQKFFEISHVNPECLIFIVVSILPQTV